LLTKADVILETINLANHDSHVTLLEVSSGVVNAEVVDV
jgi:hypothetical protein